MSVNLSRSFIENADTLKQFVSLSKKYETFFPKTKLEKIVDWEEHKVSYKVSVVDSSLNFIKLVPQDIMSFARIDLLAGRSIIWNQKFNIDLTEPIVFNGVELSKVTESNLTKLKVSGHSSDIGPILLQNLELVKNHKYLFKGFPAGGSELTYNIKADNELVDTGSGIIWSPSLTKIYNIYLDFSAGVSIDEIFYPQIFDLTEMFGSGSEPEFDAFGLLFEDIYEFNERELVSFKPNQVVSFDSNLTLLAKIEIPELILDIPDYGIGARELYNYINFVDRQFVKQVASRPYQQGDELISSAITDGSITHYVLPTPEYSDLSGIFSSDFYLGVISEGYIGFFMNNIKTPVYSTITYFEGTNGIFTAEDKFKLDNFMGLFDLDANGDLMPK